MPLYIALAYRRSNDEFVCRVTLGDSVRDAVDGEPAWQAWDREFAHEFTNTLRRDNPDLYIIVVRKMV